MDLLSVYRSESLIASSYQGVGMNSTIEVIRFGWQIAMDRIRDLGADVSLRTNGSDSPVLTAESNYILDCRFHEIHDPKGLDAKLKEIVGVVEHGLFVGIANTVIIAQGDKTVIRSKQN